jgi:hypothetical protein
MLSIRPVAYPEVVPRFFRTLIFGGMVLGRRVEVFALGSDGPEQLDYAIVGRVENWRGVL